MIGYLLNHQTSQPIHGGSVSGHIVINRDREAVHARLYNDYFADNPLYNESMFRRRYQMSRSLFNCIVDAAKDHDPYFQQWMDRADKLGLSPIQRMTIVFRMLAYGLSADATNEYIYSRTPKKKYFATKQEVRRKDVERTFGVLQSRFAIVAGPTHYWRKNVLHDIMTTCIILYNMIVEGERDMNAPIETIMETPPPKVEMMMDEK